jgi:hypothetical protein
MVLHVCEELIDDGQVKGLPPQENVISQQVQITKRFSQCGTIDLGRPLIARSVVIVIRFFTRGMSLQRTRRKGDV